MPNIAWRNVFSSDVQSVGYDAANTDLYVKWLRNHRTSVYEDVPYELFDKLSKAPSVGAMLRADIKPYYQHHYAD